MPKAAGKWNVYEITAKGPHLTIVLNGQKTPMSTTPSTSTPDRSPCNRLGRGEVPQGADQAALTAAH
jgi:hypothetical protein